MLICRRLFLRFLSIKFMPRRTKVSLVNGPMLMGATFETWAHILILGDKRKEFDAKISVKARYTILPKLLMEFIERDK